MTLYAGSVKSASFPVVSQAITAAAQTFPVAVDEADHTLFQMVAASLVGHNVTFEGSVDSTTGADGTWVAIAALRTNVNTLEGTTGVLAATPAYGWRVHSAAFSFVRVRCTAHTSGTATLTAGRTSFASPISSSNPIVQSITGTVTTTGTSTITPAVPTVTNINSAATTNGTVIKASAGTLYDIVVSNTNAATRFLKVYNSASVTVGTTTPIQTIAVPTNGTISLDFGALGLRCATGICVAITGAAADSDTTAVTALDTKVSVAFI